MPTIKDVAKLAGVSASTVSKYLNHSTTLLPEYKERVRKAIGELNYLPNQFARSMRTKKTMQIALVVSSFESQHSLGFYDTTVAKATQHGYNIITLMTNETYQGVESAVQIIRSGVVDGAIFGYIDFEDSVVPLLEEAGRAKPCVMLTHSPQDIDMNTIVISMYDGQYMVMEHLIGLGHKKIAFCAGYAKSAYMEEKIRAYRACMKAHGLKYPEEYVKIGQHNSLITGYKNATELLKLPDPPTAIAAANDMLAVGCIKAVVDARLRVPQDVAISGFDGIMLSSVYDPSITTFKQPIGEMSSIALTKLINKIEKGEEANEVLFYKGALQIGKSTDEDAPAKFII
ncbi:MAG: LacI family DNA-binding transcriptional regulator [Christensenellaceae bacterium]|jgi:DNA-binding LacI/PurR family transcriptional regulator